MNKPKSQKTFNSGIRAMLNVKRIKEHPDYKNLVPEFHNFIDNNVGTVFEIVNDERLSPNRTLVLLKNGEITYKWLIHTENLYLVKDMVND